MANISYSANFEDVIINRAMGQVDKGFYIDVGAYLPVACSNTCRLYQRGWRGVVVEPQVRFHPQWAQQRPEDIVLGVAVGDAPGNITFFDFTNHEQNCTTDPAIAQLLANEGKQVQARPVEQMSLNQIIETYRSQGDIHVLCIDVEGAEEKVLRGLDMTRHRPWLIVLEATLPNRSTPNYAGWEPLLLQSGYDFVYSDAVNRYYLAKERHELQRHFTYPPCVWDGFIDYRLLHYQTLATKLQQDLDTLKSQLKALAQ